MTVRLPIAIVVFSCVLIAGAYIFALLPGGAPSWAAWGLALGSAGALAGLMALGASRRGQLRPLALVVCLLTFLVVAGAFAAALLLPAREGAASTLWLGLPVRTAIVLYGVGLVPLIFLPAAYAWSFEHEVLSDDDLQRVRRAERGRDP